jgi:hypothetical protein
MKIDENGKRKLAAPFCESEWGSRARSYSSSAKRLEVEQWRLIDSEATIRANLLPQDDANGDVGPETDPRATLVL